MNSRATIDLSSEKKYYTAILVKQWWNIKKIPKRVAVFAIVEKELNSLLSIINRIAETPNGKFISQRTLKETAIPGHYIPTTITCYFNETIRGINNRIVCYSAKMVQLMRHLNSDKELHDLRGVCHTETVAKALEPRFSVSQKQW